MWRYAIISFIPSQTKRFIDKTSFHITIRSTHSSDPLLFIVMFICFPELIASKCDNKRSIGVSGLERGQRTKTSNKWTAASNMVIFLFSMIIQTNLGEPEKPNSCHFTGNCKLSLFFVIYWLMLRDLMNSISWFLCDWMTRN